MTKKQKIISYSIVGLLVCVVVAFFIWSLNPSLADTTRLQAAKGNTGVVYHETAESITVISSAHQGTKGVLLYPGAHVEAAAYMAPYVDFVKDSGVALIIVKPVLNLAIFDLRSPDRFTRSLPIVKQWYVAGHSLGGVKACDIISSSPQAYAGLVLLGSYCTNRIDESVPVISISGSEDGLSTPAKIKKYAKNLPDQTTYVEIKGMVHAQFGDYGDQAGDGESTISQQQAWRDTKTALTKFVN